MSLLFYVSRIPGRTPLDRVTFRHNGKTHSLFIRVATSKLPASIYAAGYSKPRRGEVFLNAVDMEDL